MFSSPDEFRLQAVFIDFSVVCVGVYQQYSLVVNGAKLKNNREARTLRVGIRERFDRWAIHPHGKYVNELTENAISTCLWEHHSLGKHPLKLGTCVDVDTEDPPGYSIHRHELQEDRPARTDTKARPTRLSKYSCGLLSAAQGLILFVTRFRHDDVFEGEPPSPERAVISR